MFITILTDLELHIFFIRGNLGIKSIKMKK